MAKALEILIVTETNIDGTKKTKENWKKCAFCVFFLKRENSINWNKDSKNPKISSEKIYFCVFLVVFNVWQKRKSYMREKANIKLSWLIGAAAYTRPRYAHSQLIGAPYTTFAGWAGRVQCTSSTHNNNKNSPVKNDRVTILAGWSYVWWARALSIFSVRIAAASTHWPWSKHRNYMWTLVLISKVKIIIFCV